MNEIFSQVMEITDFRIVQNILVITYLDGENNEITLQFDAYEFYTKICHKESLSYMQNELVTHIKEWTENDI